MRFDLLILDLDGTLVDSRDILVDLVNAVLCDGGYPRADAHAVAATIGLPLEEVFRRALPPDLDDSQAIAALCRRYRSRADALEFVRKFRLYPGVAETLALLHDARMRLVVGTSKGRATTADIVRHCGIEHLFDELIGGDCVSHGKPHPEMVDRARAQFGAAAHRTLMVGDTPFDLHMGQAAGVATCAVTYGMHPAAALRALGPDFLIDRFESLVDLTVAGPTTRQEGTS